MLSGLENFTRKVVLEILSQDERGLVRIAVASCNEHTYDGHFSRTGPGRRAAATLTPDVAESFECDPDLLDGFSSREAQENCTSQDGILSLYGVEVRAEVSTVTENGTYRIVAIDWVQKDNVFGHCDLESRRGEQRREHL